MISPGKPYHNPKNLGPSFSIKKATGRLNGTDNRCSGFGQYIKTHDCQTLLKGVEASEQPAIGRGQTTKKVPLCSVLPRFFG